MKRLREIKPGECFSYGGVTWVRLPRSSSDYTMVIAETSVFQWAFDIHNCNDWGSSSLRRELNGTFFNSMVDNGADPDAFKNVCSDLTADDGTTDYGCAKDRIAIPTDSSYRMMRAAIPRYEGIWWTLTPATCNIENSQYVRVVMPDGTITKREANFETAGVRPVCSLSLNIQVHTDEETKQIRRKTSVKEGAEAVMETLEEYGAALWGEIIVEVIKAIFAIKTDAKALAKEIADTRKESLASEAPDGAY